MLKYSIPHKFIMVCYYVNPNEVNFNLFFFNEIFHWILIAEEKIFNMRHVLPDGSIIHLSKLSRALFQQSKCSIDAHIMQVNEISTSMQQALPFLHASGIVLV